MQLFTISPSKTPTLVKFNPSLFLLMLLKVAGGGAGVGETDTHRTTPCCLVSLQIYDPNLSAPFVLTQGQPIPSPTLTPSLSSHLPEPILSRWPQLRIPWNRRSARRKLSQGPSGIYATISIWAFPLPAVAQLLCSKHQEPSTSMLLGSNRRLSGLSAYVLSLFQGPTLHSDL